MSASAVSLTLSRLAGQSQTSKVTTIPASAVSLTISRLAGQPRAYLVTIMSASAELLTTSLLAGQSQTSMVTTMSASAESLTTSLLAGQPQTSPVTIMFASAILITTSFLAGKPRTLALRATTAMLATRAWTFKRVFYSMMYIQIACFQRFEATFSDEVTEGDIASLISLFQLLLSLAAVYIIFEASLKAYKQHRLEISAEIELHPSYRDPPYREDSFVPIHRSQISKVR